MANNYHFPAPYTGLYGVGGATTVLSKEQLREIRLPRTVEELKRDSGVYLYNAYTASLAYYEALRRGEMTRLFEIKATEANGLDIIADIHDYIGVNLFRTLTRFTTNALFAQYPDAYDSMFWKQFERSAGFNSSQGMGIIVTEPGKLMAVEPFNYRRLTDAQVILQPRSTDNTLLPNKVDVHILYDNGMSEGITYALNGNARGGMEDKFNSMINGVFTWGDGDSDYTDLISITREYIRRITHFSRTLNKIGSPHLIIDQSTLAQMQQTGVGEADYDARGMIFPVASGNQKPEWLAFDAQQDAIKQQIERMLTAWHSATGIPPVLFHPQVAHSSGVSIERQLQMFIWKIQRWQREIEELVPQVAQAMGLPVMSVEFPDNLASFRETETDIYDEEDERQGAMDART